MLTLPESLYGGRYYLDCTEEEAQVDRDDCTESDIVFECQALVSRDDADAKTYATSNTCHGGKKAVFNKFIREYKDVPMLMLCSFLHCSPEE